ncbi:MAG: XRE family transcriptional regulator [Sphingobacteriales bacterium]|nr:MAG: XRE family transcriptional regulator [Sphingobacteriales bacterium]
MISENLKTIRKFYNLKLNEIPDFIGVTAVTWNDYERGKSNPPLKVILKISEKTGISIDDLLKEKISDLHLIQNEDFKKNQKKLHPNLHQNLHLIPKKYPQNEGNSNVNEPCSACLYKDQIILHKDKLIEALQGQINALNSLVAKLSADAPTQKKQAG